MITEKKLSEIEARADKATAGPWIYVELASHPCFSAVQGTAADIRANTSRSPRCYSPYNDSNASQISSDFEFIAAAREVVPALCAEVRWLREALDAQPVLELAGWVFQHEERGTTCTLADDGVNNPENFLENNPRYYLVSEVFRKVAKASEALGVTS